MHLRSWSRQILGFHAHTKGNWSKSRKMSSHTQHENPNLCQRSTTTQWEVGRPIRFLAGAAIRSLPFYATLRKGKQFEWMTECEQAFRDFKEFLGRPPILSRPREGEPLILYLAVGSRANSLSTSQRRRTWAKTRLLHQQSATGIWAELPENRKVCLYPHSNISTTSSVLPGSHY